MKGIIQNIERLTMENCMLYYELTNHDNISRTELIDPEPYPEPVIINDKATKIITMTQRQYEKMLKEGKNNAFAIQTKAWFRLEKVENVIYFIRDFSIFSEGNKHPFPKVKPKLMDNDEFDRYVQEKNDVIEEFVVSGVVPDECKDVLWFRDKRTGRNVKMRCRHLCPHKGVCKYYNGTRDLMHQVM